MNRNLEEGGELGELVGLVGENKVAVSGNVHLVVQHNPLGLVVLVDHLGLDVRDVFAVIVNVLLGRLPVLHDIVIVPVVDDEDAAGLEHVVHVLDAGLLVPEIEIYTRSQKSPPTDLRSPWSSIRWGKELPMQMMES